MNLGTVYVNAAPLDSSLVYLPIEVTHGRSTMFAQPDAPAMEFETHGPTQLAHVGDVVELQSGEGQGSYARWGDPACLWADGVRAWSGALAADPVVTRFVGQVTEVTATELDGVVVGYAMRAIGGQARLGRINVLLSRPVETDTARVAAISAAAGVPITVVGDPSLSLAADNIDRDALSAIYEVCESTGALFWQARNGDLMYGTSGHRSGATTDTLPASAILDGLEWTKDVGQIINHLTVTFPRPTAPPRGSQGFWSWQTSTDMADPGSGNFRLNADPPSDATAMALDIVTDDGTDVANFLGNYQTDTRVYLQEKADSTLWVVFRVTGDPIDQGGWFEFPIVFEDSAPAGDIKKNTSIAVLFSEVSDEIQETYSDTDSIAAWGYRHADATTLCADADEAGILALTILARRSRPFWNMPGVLIPMFDLDTAATVTVEGFEVSEGILVPVPDIPGATPAPVQQWAVEGWVESWAEDGRWMQLAVSDWARSSAAVLRSWQTVNDDLTWTTAAAKTWQTLLAEVV